MDSQDSFLEFYIEKLINGASVPIDLTEVSRRIGAKVREREMVPEAAMQVKRDEFHIFLQSNFKERPGAAARQRFSYAHEIAHALFYELRDGELKSRRDAPTGERLEQACHKAAAMLLVPTKILREQISGCEQVGAAAITAFAVRFDVSIEVMIRRLSDVRAFESSDTAPVLTRRSGGTFVIEFAVYPPWLKCHLQTPKRGGDFMEWLRPADQSEGVVSKTLPGGRLNAQPFDASNSLRIFELRFQPR